MMNVFVLRHVHEFNDGFEDEKLIGVYDVKDEAQAAIERLIDKPGFCYQPNGFQIYSYEIGADNWTDGYSILRSIYVKNIGPQGTKFVCVSAAARANNVFEICSVDSNGFQLEYNVGDFVRCEEFYVTPDRKDLLAIEKAEGFSN
jgi:hypothetical protein